MKARLPVIFLTLIAAVELEGGALDAWTKRVNSGMPFGPYFSSITASDHLLLARTGSGSEQATSNDGTNWSLTDRVLVGTVVGLGYGNDRFVAVGTLTSPTIYASTDDGASWNPSLAFSVSTRGGVYTRVAFGAGRFVAVGTTEPLNQPLLYGDGLSWQAGLDGYGNGFALWDVIYGGNQFVAVGTTGTILTSPNGLGWLGHNSGTTTDLGAVAYGGGGYLAIGKSVTITSTDGQEWRLAQATGMGNITSLAYGAGFFVGVGPGGLIQSTTDGNQWTTRRNTDSAYTGGPLEGCDVVFYKGSFYVAYCFGILQSGTIGPVQLQIRSSTLPAQIQLAILSEPGLALRMQASADLANWQDWLSVTNSTGSTNLSTTISSTARFYRAVSP